jgi:hypothetical protein
LLHVEQRKVLFEAGDEEHTSYFPLTAIISLVLVLQTGDTVESAMVGSFERSAHVSSCQKANVYGARR